eukprot:TRINITY_DN28488_c0_g1_i1.p1 TRINITY_DN28488_c0_g1~~TRINITY_DN28488_c0_g1_i1.p1  ORF type:complete len:263 (-),score=25.66 TRINITY_DN28488_c0_g1_i1:115-903(-)
MAVAQDAATEPRTTRFDGTPEAPQLAPLKLGSIAKGVVDAIASGRKCNSSRDPRQASKSLKASPRVKGARYSSWNKSEDPSAASRPSMSARATPRRAAKSVGPTHTERWREAGYTRWPQISKGDDGRRSPEHILPARLGYESGQPSWHSQLWGGSLRRDGLLLQHPSYANVTASVKDLHQQWNRFMPMSSREWPYSGSTASGRMTLPNPINPKNWVERPVASGKVSLEHLGGARYKWPDSESSPRHCLHHYEWPLVTSLVMG